MAGYVFECDVETQPEKLGLACEAPFTLQMSLEMHVIVMGVLDLLTNSDL